MKELIIGTAIVIGLWLAASGLILLGIYWTHYPYGRKRRKRRK